MRGHRIRMDSQLSMDCEESDGENHKLKVLRLHNQILEVKKKYLNLLKEHYENYWLDLELKNREYREYSNLNKAKYTTYSECSKKLEDSSSRVKEANKILTEEVKLAEQRLERFNSLDPKLLSEYKRLKEEHECQELLVKLSLNNSVGSHEK